MKKIIFFTLNLLAGSLILFGQNKPVYPTPEFNNEINFLNKENMTLVRLEKGNSKMEGKTKMGGMGGGEQGYTLEGSKSPVRIPGGKNLFFIFYTGSTSSHTTPEADSMMQANGMDNPAMSGGMSGSMDMLNDPSRTTSLYNMHAEKGIRRVTVMAYGGMKLFGKPQKESIKYTLSIKKIKEGYYEMVVDKPLPKGEYVFTLLSMGSMDGSTMLFAFGVD